MVYASSDGVCCCVIDNVGGIVVYGVADGWGTLGIDHGGVGVCGVVVVVPSSRWWCWCVCWWLRW